MDRLPVTAVTAIDAASRDAVVMSAQLDAPGAVVVRHDLSGAGQGRLRRVVSDVGGVVEDVVVPLEHTCLACAVREDLLPTLRRLAGNGSWDAALLALPLAAEPVPVVRGLLNGLVDGVPATEWAELAGVVAAVDAARVLRDALGDDSLADRGLAHGDDDDRCVGEVIARQLRGADLVLALADDGVVGRRQRALLEHLARPGTVRVDGASASTGPSLLSPRHDPDASRGWDDPRCAEPSGAPDDAGVWTLDLADWRPLHPDRLHDRIEALAAGRLVGRGRFWLPTRPRSVCQWDGAGGQLSVGDSGPWTSLTGTAVEPSTRLVVTGVDEDPQRVLSAFESALMTDAELAAGLARWAGRSDGFEPWLGAVGADEAA